MATQHDAVVEKNKTKQQYSIAIVEDDKYLREVMTGILRLDTSTDWTIHEFASATAAWQALSADIATGKRLVPDMMIMDIHFKKGMSGIECLQRLQAQQIEILTLVVSSDATYETVFNALRAGALGYIEKLAEWDKFLGYIHEIKEGSSPMSGQVARLVARHFQVYAPKTHNKQESEISPRELEVLTLMAQDLSVPEIAEKLGIAEPTIKKHFQRIYRKLHVHTRQDAIAEFASRSENVHADAL